MAGGSLIAIIVVSTSTALAHPAPAQLGIGLFGTPLFMYGPYIKPAAAEVDVLLLKSENSVSWSVKAVDSVPAPYAPAGPEAGVPFC